LAEFFNASGLKDSAIVYAHQSLEVARAVPYLKGIADAGKFLSTLYDSIHQNDSAFFYQKIFIISNDSMNNRAKVAGVENLTLMEQIRQQEKQLAEHKAMEEQQQNIQCVLIAVGIIVFIILFLALSRSIIVTEKWISFFGILGLLIVFEFINLIIHPFLERATHHSPLIMLISLVALASLLIPLHHRMEKWIKEKMTQKNKKIRLDNAKKTIEKLQGETNSK
jgi:phosphate starvation-inducible membrane PsiE